ncbi:MAG TPA: hypothetical protein VMS08_03435 [Candidatus Saccharimonadia bacterium]|nr:hypothetical protein [Candidatus Saccharimonadia bacterium]
MSGGEATGITSSGQVGYGQPGQPLVPNGKGPAAIGLGTGPLGDTTVGSAADLAAFASSSAAAELLAGAGKQGLTYGGGRATPTTILSKLQGMGVSSDPTLNTNLDPIITAYQQWLASSAAGKAQTAGADALINSKPGQAQTILTPNSAKGTIIGGI